MESFEEVTNNVNKLIDKGFLINVKLKEGHIISTKTVDKNSTKKLVRCRSCGNVRELSKDKVRCDFCYRKLDKKDII